MPAKLCVFLVSQVVTQVVTTPVETVLTSKVRRLHLAKACTQQLDSCGQASLDVGSHNEV